MFITSVLNICGKVYTTFCRRIRNRVIIKMLFAIIAMLFMRTSGYEDLIVECSQSKHSLAAESNIYPENLYAIEMRTLYRFAARYLWVYFRGMKYDQYLHSLLFSAFKLTRAPPQRSIRFISGLPRI